MPYVIAYPGALKLYGRKAEAEKAAREMLQQIIDDNPDTEQKVVVYQAKKISEWFPTDGGDDDDPPPSGGEKPKLVRAV